MTFNQKEKKYLSWNRVFRIWFQKKKLLLVIDPLIAIRNVDTACTTLGCVRSSLRVLSGSRPWRHSSAALCAAPSQPWLPKTWNYSSTDLIDTADFIYVKGTWSIHTFNVDYLSIPKCAVSCGYLFHEIPSILYADHKQEKNTKMWREVHRLGP